MGGGQPAIQECTPQCAVGLGGMPPDRITPEGEGRGLTWGEEVGG